MELGILSLGDLQRDQRTGRLHRPVDRMAEILGYAVLAVLCLFSFARIRSPR